MEDQSDVPLQVDSVVDSSSQYEDQSVLPPAELRYRSVFIDYLVQEFLNIFLSFAGNSLTGMGISGDSLSFACIISEIFWTFYNDF